MISPRAVALIAASMLIIYGVFLLYQTIPAVVVEANESCAPYAFKVDDPVIFKKCGNSRVTLDFTKFSKHYPQLASQVVLVRERIRDQVADYSRDMKQALNWHLRLTAILIMLGALALLTKREIAEDEKPRKGIVWAIVNSAQPLFFSILVVGAIAQSFSYHSKYAALFSANRAYVSLSNYVDVELVSLALTGKVEAINLNSDLLRKIEEIEKMTAAAYGETYSTMEVPN
ncbi:hypothetical protein [Nitrincola sp.]|uniref:hypothetical protein n=1 Tax=Nitrincola sp. TaxID=1926584 RepID=UPI003A940706